MLFYSTLGKARLKGAVKQDTSNTRDINKSQIALEG